MAMAVLRFLPYIARMLRIKSFSKILRAVNLFVNANSKLKVRTILSKKDLYNLAKHYKDKKHFVNFIKDILFKNLETHRFIFFSEKELKEYILRIDNRARILKILETNEVDLYMVEFSDIRKFLDIERESIIQELTELAYVNQMTVWFNYFLTYSLRKLRETEQNLENYLIYLTDSQDNSNDLFDFLENMRNQLKNQIDSIINQRKAEDIANTYCISCSCCCSCDEGSCCCSCDCDLVHYTQSWEDARADLKEVVDNAIDSIKRRIYNDYLDRNNQNSFIYHLFNDLINKQNNDSYIMIFLYALQKLLFNFKEKSRNKLLFAVIKVKNVIKNEEKGKKLRFFYNFFKNLKGQKIEKKKLFEMIRKAYYVEFNKNLKDNQISAYISKIKKNYIKIMKIKEDDKEYYYIL